MAKASSPRSTSAMRCAKDMPNAINHDQCCMVDAAFCWVKSLSRSTRDLVDVMCRWPTQIFPCQCAYAMVNVWRPWLMLRIVGQCWLHDEHNPWMMLPDVRRCKYRPTDSHMPRPMCASFGWCCISLANITFWMCTCPVRCVKALSLCNLLLADIVCPIHAGHNRWRPINSHTPQIMSVGLGICCQSLANVACSMRTS